MKIAIIGGGAAGMMCAATINELSPKAEVFLIEKNTSLGKKVIISGGGRCNVTTGLEDVKRILENYPRGSKFLSSAVYGFPPSAVREWFEGHGVPLKCENDNRVFPVSDKGEDVVNVFKKIFKDFGTEILPGHKVDKIVKSGEEFKIHFTNFPELVVDRVVFALGGQAYRGTGSTGDGYELAESLGHTITKLAPSLHSFITAEAWPKNLAGVSFPKATIYAGSEEKKFTGPFLFTHSGISGPAVFALSSLVAFESFDRKKSLPIKIDLLPDFSSEELFKTLKEKSVDNVKQSFKNYLRNFVPEAVAVVVCTENKIAIEKKYAIITDEELKNVAIWLKGAPLNAVGKGGGDEFVTAGGVKLTEIDPQTMESKVCQGLYFGGEIMDIDGFTGGFNLQASWATGRRAGESIAR
ncbi:MAG: aminoacetone oxidase family FAD-binding enzyme [Patescibacteria group bacterium]|jgi:hypothetical protein